MAVLGLRLCARAFSSCGKWGPLFIAVRGPLIIAASLATNVFYCKRFMFKKSKCLTVMALKSHKNENKFGIDILYQKIKKYPSTIY